MERRPLQKETGAYYTPDNVVLSLLRWAIRHDNDRLLDPSCGDGRFIAAHRNAIGIEQDIGATHTAINRAPWALVHEGDFFAWAGETLERFDCAAGNPPFIRYQTFNGTIRNRALSLCSRLGADFSGLASSWAPFLVATASLLKPGGRMAFVVPAEIGHAPYAAPLLEYLVSRFSTVHIVAIRKKLFPDLSEDCWLLYAAGFEGKTSNIRFTILDRFDGSVRPPRHFLRVSVEEWRTNWNRRLRPFLMSSEARDLYRNIADRLDAPRLGNLASVGLGYVSGANEFFHLRPSDAESWKIPPQFLHPSVRNGRALPASRVTAAVVERWKRDNHPFLRDLPRPLRRYLDTDAGRAAREAYKCRMRVPWYSVPDVQVPDFFLSYMSGVEPNLVRNDAHCTCTNSVHSVRLKRQDARRYLSVWGSEIVQLSCEIEGHPLGGGLLKLEPGEAAKIILPMPVTTSTLDPAIISEAINTMRIWRHRGDQA